MYLNELNQSNKNKFVNRSILIDTDSSTLDMLQNDQKSFENYGNNDDNFICTNSHSSGTGNLFSSGYY